MADQDKDNSEGQKFTFGDFLQKEAEQQGTVSAPSAFRSSEADAMAKAGIADFVPLDTNAVLKFESAGLARMNASEADSFKAIPLARQYVIGYLDAHKHGKGICTTDRVMVLGHGDTQEEVLAAAESAKGRQITIYKKNGEPWSGLVTEGFEIWTIKNSEWSFLPPSSDEKDEEKRVLSVLNDHNSEERADWGSGATDVKGRVKSTKEFKETEEESEKRREAAEASQKQAELDSRELFDDQNIQDMAQTDLKNQHLPWYVIAFLAPEGRRERAADRGIMRVFGPFKQAESKAAVKALGRVYPHACVRGTQLAHVGALEPGEPQEAEEFVFADDRVSEWVQPPEQAGNVASNFDELMTDRQKLYLEMCRRKGITPSLVEAGESKIEMAEEADAEKDKE